MTEPTKEKAEYFFKYEYGYINIDSKNLYLTNSGNWSEIEGMEEKSPKTVKKSDRRKLWILIYLIIGFSFTMLLHAGHLTGNGASLVLALLLPLSCIPLYKYMRNELGPKYLVPIKKINSVEDENTGIRLNFKNESYEDDTVFLNYPRGLDAGKLKQILESYKSE
ncbi:MAG TPA: hypothetical protein VN922_17885 [Bacteroidia bacterium]|nr:hypothetical protein [Bacteroidia bacterium]